MNKLLPLLFFIIALLAFSLWFFVFKTPPDLEVKGSESTFNSIASIIVGAMSLATAIITLIGNLKGKKK